MTRVKTMATFISKRCSFIMSHSAHNRGQTHLGTWQRVFYAEFDGQRDKRVIVKVMGE